MLPSLNKILAVWVALNVLSFSANFESTRTMRAAEAVDSVRFISTTAFSPSKRILDAACIGLALAKATAQERQHIVDTTRFISPLRGLLPRARSHEFVG